MIRYGEKYVPLHAGKLTVLENFSENEIKKVIQNQKPDDLKDRQDRKQNNNNGD